MKVRYLVATAAALAISTAAFAAEDGEALFKKSSCVSCHSVDKKSVGPSLKAVAAKYKDDKGAQATLEAKVRNGGKGSFGSMPMPATAKTVSDENIKAIVSWVLTQK